MNLNENREVWVNRVDDFKSRNLTQAAWCEKNGVKVSALRYWLRNLSETSTIVADAPPYCEFEFASVSIAQDFSSALVIEIKGVKLSITSNYDEMLLLKLIRTLKKL